MVHTCCVYMFVWNNYAKRYTLSTSIHLLNILLYFLLFWKKSVLHAKKTRVYMNVYVCISVFGVGRCMNWLSLFPSFYLFFFHFFFFSSFFRFILFLYTHSYNNIITALHILCCSLLFLSFSLSSFSIYCWYEYVETSHILYIHTQILYYRIQSVACRMFLSILLFPTYFWRILLCILLARNWNGYVFLRAGDLSFCYCASVTLWT